MKAAVITQIGQAPVYQDAPEPQAGPGEIVVEVVAAAIKNIDKMMAAGSHYSTTSFPMIPGIDGVVRLPSGQLAYTGGRGGLMAERATVNPDRCLPLPTRMDPALAAALPNAALSAWFALNGRAAFQPGETLLVLGATGVTGQLAVQLAKRMGAGRIVAAGRDPARLAVLRQLGADQIVSLMGDQARVRADLLAALSPKPIDLVIDYLWGPPAELTLEILTGDDVEAEAHRIRYLQVGEMAGSHLRLAAATLRSRSIEVFGQGGGSIPKELYARAFEVVPELMQAAAAGELHLVAEAVPLSAVGTAWTKESSGRRQVVMPGQ